MSNQDSHYERGTEGEQVTGRKQALALRDVLSRTHLLEQHVNKLYNVLRMRFPDDTEFLDDLLGDWQEEVGEMHAAFLRGDVRYFDDYEGRFH